MKVLNKIGIVTLILVMILSDGWIEVIYAEGTITEDSINTEEINLKNEDNVKETEEKELIEQDKSTDEAIEITIEEDIEKYEVSGEINSPTEIDIMNDKPKEFNLLNSQPRKHLLAGYDFSGVIMEDGSIWGWGANESSQLGLGDKDNRLHPVRLDTTFNPADIRKTITIDGMTYVHLNNGSLYRWGKSGRGQGELSKPTRIVNNITDIGYTRVQPELNGHDAIAYVENGQVRVYGSKYNSQSGRGISGYGAAEACTNTWHVSSSNRKPVLTSGTINNCSNNSSWKTVSNEKPLTNVRLIEGSSSTRAFVTVTNDGSIYTWGQNYTSFARENPNNTIDGNIVKFSFGSNIYAITDKNEIWEWTGWNGHTNKLDIDNVKDVKTNKDTAIILTHDGNVYGKGGNAYGQLGNIGSSVGNFTLIRQDVNEIALGRGHALFEDKSGKIFGQGWNGYRQLANEDDGVKEEFTKIPALSGITDISAEIESGYAVRNNRELLAWGRLSGGNFGAATNKPRSIRTFDTDIRRIDSNKDATTKGSSLVLENDKAYTWGHNYQQQLGHAGSIYTIGELKHVPNNAAYTPNTVDGKTYVVKDKIGTHPDDTTVVDAIMASNGGAAINKKGHLLTYGRSTYGFWGIGERHLQFSGSQGNIDKYSYAFVKAKTNEKFTKLDGRQRTRLALHENGTVYSWGTNSQGSLGRTGSNLLPLRMPGLSNITNISMGHLTGMALDNTGNLYTWGYNMQGQIGNGTVGDGRGVVNISGLSGIKFDKIFSGASASFAITDNGDLYAWGNNRYGQLGLGGRYDRTSPRKVDLPGPVAKADSGEEFTLVLLENGDVYAAGSDTYGQLGIGADRNRINYQEIPFPDYITLQTSDNQEMIAGDTFNINGFVTSVVPGAPLEIRYEIESANGIIESGKIKDTSSTTTNNYFDKQIQLNSKYPIGGYTVNVTVLNKISELENTQTINFGVVDNVVPSPPVINANTAWTINNVNTSITHGVDKESGVDYTEYRINNGEWNRYTNSFTISSEGQYKIQARTADRAGNLSQIASETVRIDRTAPDMSITPNIDKETHHDVILTVSATDNLSGIKSIIADGINITNTRQLKVSKNGTYSFTVEDNTGNKTTKIFTVDNIVRELKFEGPQIDGDISVEMQEDMITEIPVGNINLADWRDNNNDWKLSLQATQLASESHLLPKGTLTFKGVDRVNKIDGNKSGSISTLQNEAMIDDGPIEIINASNERGVYELVLKDKALKLNLFPDVMRSETYKSKLTWTLESTYVIN